MADPKRIKMSPTMKKKVGPVLKKTTRELPDPDIVKKQFEIVEEGRENIGARNPMVLVRNKLDSMNESNLVDYLGPNLRILLKQAFEELDYENMFDPQYGSPVYYGLYGVTVRLAELYPDKGHYAETSGKLKKEPPSGPGAPPAECKDLVKSEAQSTTINGKQTQYRDTSAGLKNQGLEFDDPVQGCVADCWLISALSSIAFVETLFPPAIKKLVRAPPIYVCPPPPSWATKKEITTDMAFYTTSNGTRPYYGRVNQKRSKPTFYEAWVSFYEKCFAAYYQQNRTPPFVQINNPSYNAINFKGAFGALMDITGNAVTTATSGYTKDYFGTNGAPDNNAGIITKIRTTACNGLALDPNGVILYTRKPAVAYTYTTAGSVPALANRNVDPYKYGDPVTYNCAGIPANHAFSILGLFEKNGVQYVVLRNPWGFAGDSASFSAALRPSLAPLPASLPDPLNIDNTGGEGIFGLKSLTFMRYFEAFGCTTAI
jgi:hypothetical protein